MLGIRWFADLKGQSAALALDDILFDRDLLDDLDLLLNARNSLQICIALIRARLFSGLWGKLAQGRLSRPPCINMEDRLCNHSIACGGKIVDPWEIDQNIRISLRDLPTAIIRAGVCHHQFTGITKHRNWTGEEYTRILYLHV